MRTNELTKVKLSTKKEIPETAKKHKLREAFPLLSSLLHSYDPDTADGMTIGLTNGLRDIFLHVKKGGFDMTPFKNRANWDKALFEVGNNLSDEDALIELLRADAALAAMIQPIMARDADIAAGLIMAMVTSDAVFQGRMRPLSIDQMIDREYEEIEDDEPAPERDIMADLLEEESDEYAADAPPVIDEPATGAGSGSSTADLKAMLRTLSEIGDITPKISYNGELDRLEVSVSFDKEVDASLVATLISAFYEISPSTTIRTDNGGIVICAAV